jgi:predicted GIY-YIG superfamily endonuclease/transcriptional regulator with XRE-family HTH domain
MIGVYVVRDTEGRAIYVGSSSDVDKRVAHHAAKARWWKREYLVERIEAPSRAMAFALERKTIKALSPEQNVVCQGETKAKTSYTGPVVRPRTEVLAVVIDAYGSVAALAQACGVNHMTLSDVWRGVHYPSSKLVARLVLVTGIPLDELFYVDPADGLLDVAIEAKKLPRRSLKAAAPQRGAA